MKIVGLTGGIGSGKSTVAAVFRVLGVPVYEADMAGREVLRFPEVIQQVTSIFGNEILDVHGQIERSLLANKVFGNKNSLEQLNAIVHPAVAHHFEGWKKEHLQSQYVVREAAIAFETGLYKKNDVNLLVTCPKDIRIARVIKRDNTTIEAVEKRMAHQWSEEKKQALADGEIVNDGVQAILPQVLHWHEKFCSNEDT